jgi:hypothetical protein
VGGPRDGEQKRAVFERLDVMREPLVQRQQPSNREIERPVLRSHLEVPHDGVNRDPSFRLGVQEFATAPSTPSTLRFQ